jgi:hypothetical protein
VWISFDEFFHALRPNFQTNIGSSPGDMRGQGGNHHKPEPLTARAESRQEQFRLIFPQIVPHQFGD